MSGALAIHLGVDGGHVVPRITQAAGLPVAGMMLGRPSEQVAELMPRLFNLCAVAQGLAVRLSLDLPVQGASDLSREILRDHLAKLCQHWPRFLGLEPRPLPQDWRHGGGCVAAAIWGGPRPISVRDWIVSQRGVAPILQAIANRFDAGEAVACLPALNAPLAKTAQENSPAGRMAEEPLMLQISSEFGKGPLWRAFGRLLDLSHWAEHVPVPHCIADGTALVPAARGTYAFRARAKDGLVCALSRVTPTDHMIAPGGALEQSLASLPQAKLSQAALVVDILDPCVPVRIEEAAHA
ncbi:HupK protein [Sinirhodobacter sp. WL0062]|uniref:HupK protein n=1 Tax=Rhodobacter flavimaris TaxID=2907145 RepID=A0ABS8YR39_9RHOB|nr:HupK protein [Sinirhodobacter sp. WL0062]MCE5972357.1 HupK protein [Sinirhodobacter sp. WL0062]